jgi:hypothetical protein
MSDFVYPSYFEEFHKPNSVRFDQMNKVTKPFQILSGGYQIIFKNGKWSQVFASLSKKKAFAKEDRRGHRSEERKGRRRRSEPTWSRFSRRRNSWTPPSRPADQRPPRWPAASADTHAVVRRRADS